MAQAAPGRSVALGHDPSGFQASWVWITGADSKRWAQASAQALSDASQGAGCAAPFHDRAWALPSPVGRAQAPAWAHPNSASLPLDIRARPSDEFIASGGVAALVVEACAPLDAVALVGLPSGARLRVDGVTLAHVRGPHEDVPDLRRVPVRLSAGLHLVTVELPARPKRPWYGAGFFMRWARPDGRLLDLWSDAPALRVALPVNANDAALSDAALARMSRRARIGLERSAQGWRWRVRVNVALNAPARANASERLALQARPGGPAVALAVDGTHSDVWDASPGAEVFASAPWDTRETSPPAQLRDAQVVSGERAAGASAPSPIPTAKAPARGLTRVHLARAAHLARALDTPHGRSLSAAQRSTLAYPLQLLRDAVALPPSSPRAPKRDADALAALLRASQNTLDARAKDPKAPVWPWPGTLHTRAYRSTLTGRLEPYTIAEPVATGAQQAEAAWFIGLHGRRGTSMRMCRAMLGGASLAELAQRAGRPIGLLCPRGLGDTAFRYAGERDLLDALQAAAGESALWSPDRLVLVGASDGGLAAFELGTHAPERWAAVVALGAVAHMRAFPTLRGGLTPHERAWVRAMSPLERAANASGTTWRIAYGARDRLPSDTTADMARALERAGARVRFDLHPDLGHDVWTRTFARGDLLVALAHAARAGRPQRMSAPPQRGGLPGVTDDLWAAPLHIVYGTQDPHNAALYRYLARLERARWSRDVDLPMRVEADRDAARPLDPNATALVIGPADANSATHDAIADVDACLPDAAPDGSQQGVRRLLHPPLARLPAVVWSGGRTPSGAAWASHLPELIPGDVVAGSEAVRPPWGLTLGRRQLRRAQPVRVRSR